MGLDLTVGFLAEMIAFDEEAAESFKDKMISLNEYLASVELAAHHEPEMCDVVSYEMHSYSGLHYLRRIAAHLDLHGVLPAPGEDDELKDPVVDEYNRLADQGEPGFLGRLFRRPMRARSFDHLMLHSDCEGYYLPQDFPNVLFPPQELEIPGGMVGSSNRLMEECKRLAQALQLPLDIDPEAEEVWEAGFDSEGKVYSDWKRYGVESYICLRLHRASEQSLKTGAAIVFH
jgi:hypothetical protein